MPQVSQGSAVIREGEKISVPGRLGESSWSSEEGKPNNLTSCLYLDRGSQAEGASFLPQNFTNFIFSWCSEISLFQLSASLGTKSPEVMMDQGQLS